MDRGQLWSFCRDVLGMGAMIERATKGENYERYSARLDRTASQYADQLETLLKGQTPCDPADDGERLCDTYLAACGSDTESPSCFSGHEFKLPDGSRLFLWGREGGGYSVTLTAHPELDDLNDDVSREVNLAEIDTRGQFRRLVAVLGIPPCDPAPPSTSSPTTHPAAEPGQSAESCGGTEPR